MKLTLATSIKYGNYKHLQPDAKQVFRWIKRYWDDFKDHFDFDHDVEFHVRPVRGKTHGWYLSNKKRIEIDPRYSALSVLDTIAHELVHAEQYKQGRLEWNSKHSSVWNGEHHNRGTTHKQYLNRPWEIEARLRAAEFVKDMEAREKPQFTRH
jgi:predicted SprT family Zn-dependent metalloprotease